MITLKSLEELNNFAKNFSKEIQVPITIGLIGELGAGKTTFIKYLLQHLGVEETVTSPTYVLEHIYKTDDLLIEHWDLYRLDALPEELEESPDKNTIRLIEWIDKAENYHSVVGKIIKIEILSENTRKITIQD